MISENAQPEPEMIETDSSFVERADQISVDYVKISNNRGLKDLDIAPSVLRIEINQGLMHPFMFGKILLSDFHNMRNILPIIGDEILEISLKIPGSDPIIKKFYTRDVSFSIDSPVKNQLLYEISFCSGLFGKNLTTKISKTYKNSKKDIIAKKIYEDYLKTDSIPIVTTPTEETTTIIFPYLSPIDCIDLLAETSSYQDNYDYVFYEDLNRVNFISLSTKKESDYKFYFTTSDNLEYRAESGGAKSLAAMRQSILNITISGKMNSISDNIINGTYSGINLNFDMLNKKINKIRYSYLDRYQKEKHVELAPPIPLDLNQDLSSKNLSTIVVTNEPSSTFRRSEKPLQVGRSHFPRKNIDNMFFQTASLEIHGKTSVLPGDIVFLDLRKRDVGLKMDNDPQDPLNSGRYMVMSVVHYINRANSTCRTALLVGRDSLPRPIPSSTTFNV